MRTFSNVQCEGRLLSWGGYRKRTTGRVASGKEVVSRKASEVDSDFDRRIGFEPSTDSGKWKRILSRQMRTIQKNGDASCGAGMGTSEP